MRKNIAVIIIIMLFVTPYLGAKGVRADSFVSCQISMESPQEFESFEHELPLNYTLTWKLTGAENVKYVNTGYSINQSLQSGKTHGTIQEGQTSISNNASINISHLKKGYYLLTIRVFIDGFINSSSGFGQDFQFSRLFGVGLPNVRILSIQPFANYTNGMAPLTFSVDRQTVWERYSLDGSANVTIQGNTTITGLHNGLHSLVVYAQDTNGNSGMSSAISFNVEGGETQITNIFEALLIIVILIVVASLIFVYFKRQNKNKLTNKQSLL